MRTIQHKKEAYWFYRFLSIFYDNYVNPFFWTEEMRSKSLELANLKDKSLITLDAGSGTGFTTQGIAKQIDAANITCLDQSPHQMEKAKNKSELKDCKFILGDAENLPFPTDHFDRYISAGSIEYWPNPQQGIAEAYRVLKPGGVALIIGPLKPEGWLARTFAHIWMLFPEEEEYIRWYKDAGFVNIEMRWVAPDWILKEKYGIAIAGTKPVSGASPAQSNLSELESRNEKMTWKRALSFVPRLLVGTIAGFIFLPMAIFGKIRFYTLRLFSRRKSMA